MLQPIQREVEVTAEDEQVFLMRQQTQLAKQPAPRQGVSKQILLLNLHAKEILQCKIK